MGIYSPLYISHGQAVLVHPVSFDYIPRFIQITNATLPASVDVGYPARPSKRSTMVTTLTSRPYTTLFGQSSVGYMYSARLTVTSLSITLSPS